MNRKTNASASPARRVFIKSYGCQMNVYDSVRMADVLTAEGFEETDSPSEADLVILNTCHIREKAAEKVYSELGRLRKIKAERKANGRETLVAVAGCVAQAEGDEIIHRAPVVDMVFGPQSYHRLPDFVSRAEAGESVVDTEFPAEDKFDHLPLQMPKGARGQRRASAFLTVQEGCDKFCTFCVVPYTRGAEFSRPVTKIVDEARRLVAGGVSEITLLGQNVNAYHGEGPDGREWCLARLIEAVAGIGGIKRLRYTTSHPRDMDDALIAAHRDIETLMPYLHLPVQSGSDRVLKAMNRGHGRNRYLEIIEDVRAARPDLALSSDFIVGFPGEGDEDFEDTLDLVRRVRYAQAFSFKYSARPGTPAADAGDQVPEAVKAERLQRLQVLLRDQQAAFADGLVGQTLPVLFEKPGKLTGQIVGRSPYLQPVQVMAPENLMGAIMPVTITEAGPNSLFGHLTDPPDNTVKALTVGEAMVSA